MDKKKSYHIPKVLDIYWCQYAEGGATYVCRFFDQKYWFGVGKTPKEALLDCLKNNKNPNYPYL